MAKSLAFWLEGSKSEKANVELHVNYWSLNNNSKTNLDYLDVGVKFSGIQDADSINIFFPFTISKEKYISDLGRAVCDADNLISAIFNTHIKEKKPNGERADITFIHEKEPNLRFHCQIETGEKGEGVTLNEDDDSGTTISFPIKLFKSGYSGSDNEELPNYFRFRINMSPEDKKILSQVHKSKDSKVLSRLESTEIVDFRINENRNLPPKIRSKLENDPCITCVHFFLIRETDSEHKLSHTEFKRCRVLEKDLWDTYLKSGNGNNVIIPDQMLIYHWKEDTSEKKSALGEKPSLKYLDNFSAFAKFSKTTVSYSTILYFLATVILLGLFSGFVSGLGASYTYTFLTSEEMKPDHANLSNPCTPYTSIEKRCEN